jgi:hypothetical protein
MQKDELLIIINKLRTTQKEWNAVDAKRKIAIKEMGEKAEFVKDVVAMANNGEQSYLIIGLEDGTFADVGNLSCHYTKNDLNQFLVDKIDPPVIVDYTEFEMNGNEYAVIEIFGENPPYIVAQDLICHKTDKKRMRIHKGTIFVRHDDRTEGISRIELEKMLQRKGIRKEFETETEHAQQLVRDRPDFWEYRLTAELLKTRIENFKRAFENLNKGLLYKRTSMMQGREFVNWLRMRSRDLTSLIALLKVVFTEEFPSSWGKPPDEAGDPLSIKAAVDKVSSAFDEMLEWESDLRSVLPPEPCLHLKRMLEGWTLDVFEGIERIPKALTAPLEEPNPTGKRTIKIVINGPANIEEALAEMDRLTRQPVEWWNNY